MKPVPTSALVSCRATRPLPKAATRQPAVATSDPTIMGSFTPIRSTSRPVWMDSSAGSSANRLMSTPTDSGEAFCWMANSETARRLPVKAI